jgi:hypothetical protein
VFLNKPKQTCGGSAGSPTIDVLYLIGEEFPWCETRSKRVAVAFPANSEKSFLI